MKSETKLCILFIHPDLRIGGAERQLVNLAKGLVDSQKFEIVIALYDAVGPLFEEISCLSSIKIVDLNRRRVGRLKSLIKLIQLTNQENIEVIYSFLVGPNIFASLLGNLLKRKKIVWGNRVSWFEFGEFGIKGFIADLTQKLLSRNTDIIISNSVAGLHYQINRGYKPRKNCVIHNGIETTTYRPDKVLRDIARKEFGATPNTVVIGMLARVVRWKGYDVFLEAASVLRESLTDVMFICVGSGNAPLVARYVEKANTLGLQDFVKWLGPRNDIAKLLNGMDIVTSASTSGEGFSNVVAEAMAVGKVVVATDVGEVRAVVGKSGVLVRPSSSDELVKAWLHLSKDKQLRDEIGSSAREKICTSYSVEKMVNETQEILLNLE